MSNASEHVRAVFCEGKNGSLDSLFLRNIVGGSQVQSIGGKRGMRASIEAYLAIHPEWRQRYIAFRDRDFDLTPPEQPTLLRLTENKPIYTTYRACIESYLMDPVLLHQYWDYASTGPKWRHGQSPGVDVAKEHLHAAFGDIAEYEAVRWALASCKRWERWPEIPNRPRPRDKDGRLPPDLSWNHCLEAGRELVEGFLADVSVVSVPDYLDCAKSFRATFTDGSFLATTQPLIWFHGKDVATAWRKRLGLSTNEMDGFTKWAIDHVNADYYEDLRELKRRLAS